MSMSDSQTQNRKRSRETSEVFDSVFGFLMDFADKAKTIPQPKRRPSLPNEPQGEELELLEDGGDGDAGEMFQKLPVRDKEELLKDVFGEIVGNMLDKLPEDGKEAFLVRCFDGLFPKLPHKSRRVVQIKVKDVSSQSLEAVTTLSAPESRSPFPNQFPTANLCQAGFRVNLPNVISNTNREI